MIFGCIFVEFSLEVFKFLRNNSNSEYCKKKKNPCFSDLQYSVNESLKEKKKTIAIFLFLTGFPYCWSSCVLGKGHHHLPFV